MKISEFLEKTTKVSQFGRLELRPHICCKDGFNMSVQASWGHYCEPREDLKDGGYTEVEIGFPSEEEPLIMEFAERSDDPTGTVYGYVPIEIVDAVIEKHGGMEAEK